MPNSRSFPFNIYHSTFNIPRHPKDAPNLDETHPNAGLDPERAAGDQHRSASDRAKHCRLGDISADAVAEDRTGQNVPEEVDADREPEPLETLVGQREQNPGENQIEDRHQRDAAIASMQRREDDRGGENRRPAIPPPHLLKQISAKGELLVECGRSENRQQLQPRKSAASSVSYIG